MKNVSHPNIIKLYEVVVSKKPDKKNERGHSFLVQEYMEHDMNGIIISKIDLKISQIKFIMKQLFQSLLFLDENNIMHRDLKWSNILYNNKCEIKLTDFVLAKYYSKESNLNHTQRVVTL